MRQYRFRAVITLGPAAREDAARGHLGGPHTCYVVQPCHGKYFPAVICLEDDEVPLRPGVRALLSAVLADGEAKTLFAPGQRFTIWADAIIGHTVVADDLIGRGVISHRVSLPLPIRGLRVVATDLAFPPVSGRRSAGKLKPC
jgi:hypothetical protein